MNNIVYIVECADGTLYTGWTTDVEARIAAHNSGAGAKYTRGRLPVQLLYSETYSTKGEALKREHEIKKLSRLRKLELVKGKGKLDERN
jgi:putative endonuclease